MQRRRPSPIRESWCRPDGRAAGVARAKGRQTEPTRLTDEEAAAFLKRLKPNDARHVVGILIQAHGSAVFAF